MAGNRYSIGYLAGVIVAGTIAAAAPTPAGGADIRVDTLSDVADTPFAADDFCGSGTLADLPGADGQISLREALAAANHSPGPHRITFAPQLAGGTLSVSFDDLDADDTPDPLPFLCAGDTTIDGDVDGDGVPDITISGNPLLLKSIGGINLFSSGNTIQGLTVRDFPLTQILVFHPFGAAAAVSDNTVTHTVMRGGIDPMIIQASFNDPATSGTIRNTRVTDNVIAEGSGNGLLVLAADGLGASISATMIAHNQILDNAGFGVLVTTHLTAGGSTSQIDGTTISDNDVFSNGSTGIAAFSYAGQNGAITGLSIDGNRVHDNGFGISGAAGVCGGGHNTMDITVTNNVLATSGILINGGTNILCGTMPLPAASENVITASVSGNTLNGSGNTGITITGGTVSATRNAVTATVSDNTIAGGPGVTIAGGVGINGSESGPANANTVDVVVRSNHVSRAFAGIGVAGGASGVASANAVNATVIRNSACRSLMVDIQCAGGFTGAIGLPANSGTGNTVTGNIVANLATNISVGNGTAGNACLMMPQGNLACRGGDAICSGRLSAADLIRLVMLLYADERASCELDDANADGLLDVRDVPATVAALFG